MNTYQIWSVLPESSAYSVMHGQASGTCFKEACAAFFKNNPQYNPRDNTFWGCKLFNSSYAIKMTLPANRYYNGY